MTPSAYYNCKNVIRETNDLNEIFGMSSHSHIPEINEYYIHEEDNIKNEHITTKVLLDKNTDGRRIVKVITVWYDKNPVMIIRAAGREGDDHYDRFITDVFLYRSMVNYLRLILPHEEINEDEIVNSEADVANLNILYGSKIEDLIKFVN